MPTKEAVFTAIFFAIVTVSAISLVISTLNYVDFYRAIEALSLTVLDVSPSIGQNSAKIDLTFAIVNPTRYTGLSLREFGYVLYFDADGELIDACWRTNSYREQPLPIGPFSNITFQNSIDLDLSQESTKSFIKFYENHTESVKWALKCNGIFLTFIGELTVPLNALFFS